MLLGNQRLAGSLLPVILTRALWNWKSMNGYCLFHSWGKSELERGHSWLREIPLHSPQARGGDLSYERRWHQKRGAEKHEEWCGRRNEENPWKYVPSPGFLTHCLLTRTSLWFVFWDAWRSIQRGRTIESRVGTQGIWNPRKPSDRRGCRSTLLPWSEAACLRTGS